jgi:polysaccharide biosynthesis transport protein
MTVGQLLRAIRGRWLLCLSVFVLIVGATLAASLLMSKYYTASTSIVIDFRRSDPVSGNVNSGQLLPGYVATQLDIIASRGVALKVIDMLGIDKLSLVRKEYQEDTEGKGDVRQWAAENFLLKSLKLQPARDSGVVRISFTSTDPKLSADIANAFAKAYTDRALELRVEPAKQTSSWFDDQLKTTLKADLEKSVERLTQFQQKHGIVATDERLNMENTRLLELSAQLVGAQSQTFEQLSKAQQVGAMRAQSLSGNAPEMVANPVIQRLKADISAAESKLNDASSRLGVNHPEYINLQQQLASLRKRADAEMSVIAGSVSSASNASQQREASLRDAVAAQKASVLALKRQNNELAVLTRDVESAQRAYDTATQRVSQTRLEAQIDQTNVAVLNPAIEPLDPSRPRVALNMALALILGACLAPGLAILRELADRRVRGVSDVQDLYGLPVIGELPAGKRLHLLGFRFKQQRLGYGSPQLQHARSRA